MAIDSVTGMRSEEDYVDTPENNALIMKDALAKINTPGAMMERTMKIFNFKCDLTRRLVEGKNG
jgi:hypothetical protein